jgi:hypothetical protein
VLYVGVPSAHIPEMLAFHTTAVETIRARFEANFQRTFAKAMGTAR